MNESAVKEGFLGVQRGHGREVLGVKSLAQRLLTSRQSVRKALAANELRFERIIDHGSSVAYEFSSTYLDEQRRLMVDSICDEVRARMKGLNPDEREILLTQLHTLRSVSKDVETEFSRPSDDEDDRTVAGLLGKTVIGAGVVGGGAYGVNALRKKGKALNEAVIIPAGPLAPAVKGVSKGLVGDAKTGISDALKSLLKRVPKAVH